MKKFKKILAFVLALTLVLSMLFSVSLVIKGSCHTCSGVECQICSFIRSCTDIFKSIAGCLVVVALFAVIYQSYFLMHERTVRLIKFNPIVLKVKLSN